MIAITADYYYKKEKFQIIPPDFIPHFKWTNWQAVSFFIQSVLEDTPRIRERERGFALDLYHLLDKKNLRGFHGFGIIYDWARNIKVYPSVFFEPRTAKFRGDFIGFTEALPMVGKVKPVAGQIFMYRKKEIYASLRSMAKLEYSRSEIFYRRQ